MTSPLRRVGQAPEPVAAAVAQAPVPPESTSDPAPETSTEAPVVEAPPEPVEPPFPLPEVRIDQDPASPYYGCVAVASQLPLFKWGVFNPTSGGHWETDDNLVGKWAVIHGATPSPVG
jgi:hypothetical protein